ncbi:hypothetical protein GCM10020000_53990 [Streptomyces olivoverticillatus]
METARANNRQGLPLGGAYLRYASDRMREELLPAARALYETETGRLGHDYDDAESWPWAALATGVVALGALGWAQRRNYLRTNRVFNHGLLTATARRHGGAAVAGGGARLVAGGPHGLLRARGQAAPGAQRGPHHLPAGPRRREPHPGGARRRAHRGRARTRTRRATARA